MIGYPISRLDLERRIEAEKPGWLIRARARTAQLLSAGTYSEKSSIWSEIKAVFMELQGNAKCAFCERKLEAVPFGKSEQAVEHFRPKGRVRKWAPSPSLQAEGVTVTRPAAKTGYYMLAYDAFNYLAACHPCNSALKRDWFPIAAASLAPGNKPEQMLAELPLLIYPVGDFDDNPELLIHFYGLSPQATEAAGHKRNRALVTIEFFALDSPARSNLMRDRAVVIVALFPALATLRANDSREGERRTAADIVDGLTAANSPHANCARSFRGLFAKDEPEATAIFELAAKLIASKS